jgi:DNA-binding NarL/FixJ family response regulator
VLVKTEPVETILFAIERVHAGEIWLDRATTSRVFNKLVGGGVAQQAQRIAALTGKEREIVCALAQSHGLPNKRLAERLGIAEHTLRNHFSAIYAKLGLGNRLALYQYAVENGLASSLPGKPSLGHLVR